MGDPSSGVELRGVGKVYPGGIEAVAGVSLTVADGESLAIVGPSGSGKSTLLRLVAGLETLTAGEVWIAGRRADGLPPSARDLAMVFQDQAPYPHLNVFDNLAFGLRARRRPRSEINERVGQMAELLGLTTMLGRRPATLSGGQRRRVVLGRSLARRPTALLLDEPLSGLDPPMRVALRAELSALHRRLGTTTLLVTHDQGEAMALGDRVAVFDQGRLIQVAPPLELYDQPATRFVGRFIGSPPLSVLPCLIESGDGSIRVRLVGPERESVATIPRDGPWSNVLIGRGTGPIELGIRPEHVQISAEANGALLPVEGRVRRLEPLGHETLADLAVGPHSLGLRLPPDTPIRVDDPLTVRLDLSRAHWFEPETGERLV
ncbi:MAG: ABC transporter ATP-binding protein [Isosphaeraceae bacterium]